MIWPLTLSAIAARTDKVPLALAAMIVALAVWQIGLYSGGASPERIYNGLDTRASQLLTGSLVYFVIQQRESERPLGIAWLAIPGIVTLGGLFMVSSESDLYQSVGLIVYTLCVAAAVAHLASEPHRFHRLLQSRLILWGGSRSYALYLWHYPLLGIGLGYAEEARQGATVGVFAALVGTCIAAELSQRVVEIPAMRARQKFDRSLRPAHAKA